VYVCMWGRDECWCVRSSCEASKQGRAGLLPDYEGRTFCCENSLRTSAWAWTRVGDVLVQDADGEVFLLRRLLAPNDAMTKAAS